MIARTAATLDKARVELEKSGARVVAIPCDVRDQKQVNHAIAETIRQSGAIDVLINNAGVIQVGPYDQMELRDYEDAMATHAWGALYTIMAALPICGGVDLVESSTFLQSAGRSVSGTFCRTR